MPQTLPATTPRRRWKSLLLLGVLLSSISAASVWGDSPETSAPSAPVAFEKETPENLADLVEKEKQIRKISKEVIPSTVNLQVGNAQGSGVIVSKDGKILTAAHVIGRSGRRVIITLPDGRRIKGETLGLNRDLDIGLVKITEEGEWPAVEMGDIDDVQAGDWCLATGHPGGYRKGRLPVVRLGRVIMKRSNIVQTDCTLVGGDSGGPVFDMEGKVIGINSRIGASTHWNFHVPVSLYETNWDRLVNGETWSEGEPRPGGPLLGVSGEDDPKGCRLTQIGDDLPAGQAGLEAGDIITSFDGKPVKGIESLKELVLSKEPGDRVRIEILRGDETLTKMVELAERS